MWEREIELIESLGKSYPKFCGRFSIVEYKDYRESNSLKAWWVHFLCKYHLNRRWPHLEKFIRENNKTTWKMYREYFDWKKELEIIESLGKLYPRFDGSVYDYKNYRETNYYKAWWVYRLCIFHLNRRLPRLEEFIKENCGDVWDDYKDYFNITDKQCGKKS